MRGVLVALALVAGGTGVALSGWLDVSATWDDPAPVAWLVSNAVQRSVARRASAIAPPATLDGAARVEAGAAAYDAMCRECHGAPGEEPGVLGKGLQPPPPELAVDLGGWSDAQLFWIVKNGIRMTGMPAFGVTHDDEELWDVVAFLRRISGVSAVEYRDLVAAARRRAGTDAHPHGHGGMQHP